MKVSLFPRLAIFTFLALFILLMAYIPHQPPQLSTISGSPPGWTNSQDSTRIFFHETGGKGFLSLEQTCCVESAAFHNPIRKINLFLSDDTIYNVNSPWREILSSYRNIEVKYINYQDYFAGTPLEDWYRNGSWVKSPFKTVHLSDYIRIVSALKGGGLYLDLDMLVLTSLDTDLFTNFLIFEDDKNLLANAFFHLQQDNPILDELVNLLKNDYKPDNHIYHGPEALTKALRRYCNITNVFISVGTCKKVKLLPHRMMDPFGLYLWDIYFNSVISHQTHKRAYQSYSIHHFRSVNKILMINMTSNQLFGVLAQRNCPLTAEKSRYTTR